MKALSFLVLEKKNFEMFFLCSHVPNSDFWGQASFDPGGHHMNKLGRGPQRDAIYTKYESSRPSSFKEED